MLFLPLNGKWLFAAWQSGFGNELRREQAGNLSSAREGATRYPAIFFSPSTRTLAKP